MEGRTIFIAHDLKAHEAYYNDPNDDTGPYGVTFMVPTDILLMSKTLADIMEDIGPDAVIPISCNNVSISMFRDLIVPWCAYHHQNPTRWNPENPTVTVLSAHDMDLFDKYRDASLFQCITAANYLDLGELLEQCCFFAATQLFHGKTPEELRSTFFPKDSKLLG